ncbi:unnamed protein product [Clonostachys solani]|uniref:Thiamin pyrophosphokinase catalytic domain-containing protein n=1 Tax=Clonostachys solani TaxID=160281 RepID=A0A9N9ZLG4_9HYPO|nr:unnamed protein product [Clonostachys solani]
MDARFEWHLGQVLGHADQQPAHDTKFAMVVLNQPISWNRILDWLWKNAFIRVAADGGANRLHESFLSTGSPNLDHDKQVRLDAIIGDLDSLSVPVKNYFTALTLPTQIISVPGQDSWDFEKVLSWLRSNCGQNIDTMIIGDLGGRMDHGLRQIHNLILATPGNDYSGGRSFLVSRESLTFILKAGRHSISIKEHSPLMFGDHIGIMPAGIPSTVTTKGLEADVQNVELGLGERVILDRISPTTSEIEIVTTCSLVFTIELLHSS